MVWRAFVDGLQAARRAWGLSVLLLAINSAAAGLLAVPLALRLEHDLRNNESAETMLYGFDYPWWSQWSDAQPGWTASFAPDIFGTGFVVKNLDLLLKGELPAGAFRFTEAPDPSAGIPRLDALILAVGALYWLIHTLLSGGVLAILRGTPSAWTGRALIHGAGFHAGRFLRLSALALLLAGGVFVVNAPVADWVQDRARHAVSERTALAWLLGRHAALLLALLLVHLLSSYAKVILVLEERSSAALALLSSAGFCLGHFRRVAAHYGLVLVSLLGLLASWAALDARWVTIGYRTQAVTLLLAEGLMLGRLALRLSLTTGQMALYRRLR